MICPRHTGFLAGVVIHHVGRARPDLRKPRLAALYDFVDDDRSDLDVYAAVVNELGASSVLDVGCGTGTLACRLAQLGVEVVGLDPPEASLDVARRKPGAEHVHWIHGDASSVPVSGLDVAMMTGNVAQVFVTDAEWSEVPGGNRWCGARGRLAGL